MLSKINKPFPGTLQCIESNQTYQDAGVGRELVGRGQDCLRLVVDRLRLHEDHIVVGGGLEILKYLEFRADL